MVAIRPISTDRAIRPDPHLLAGLNVDRGRITHPAVAAALGAKAADSRQLLAR